MVGIHPGHHRHWHYLLVLMNESDSFKTVATETKIEFQEKGSRFIGQIFPVQNESACRKIIQEQKSLHPSANHVCYAFRLGANECLQRSSDAGEPAGTAGDPILRQLIKYELSYVMITVVRYFGGKKLGVQGLIRAYRSTAEEVIKKSKIKNGYLYLTVTLNFPYTYMDRVMRMVDRYHMKIITRKFESECLLKCDIRAGKREELIDALSPYHEIKIELE